MSHPLLIFLFLKAFERVIGLFQIFTGLFFSNLFMNHIFTSVFFCRWISYFSENFDSSYDGKGEGICWLIFIFYFYRVDQVNSEYQSSHLSLTDLRSSLGINLYLVLDSSWPALRLIRLGRVVPNLINFLNPTPQHLL